MSKHFKNTSNSYSDLDFGALLDALLSSLPGGTYAPFPHPVPAKLTSDIFCGQNEDGSDFRVGTAGQTVQVAGLVWGADGTPKRFFLAGAEDHSYSLTNIDEQGLGDAIGEAQASDNATKASIVAAARGNASVNHQANGNW